MVAKKRRFISLIVSVALLFSLTPVSAFATQSDSQSASGTYAGDAVTTNLTSVISDSDSREIDFNDDWKFYLGNVSTAYTVSYNDSSWDSVDLPHDFSITQEFTTSGEAESGFLPGGTGWYRKTFTLDSSYEDKTIVLNFDGVYSDAYVYVNGVSVGENHYGYNTFAFDISSYLNYDGTENVIAVKAVNNIPSSRWYSGSGIYRDVTLIVSDTVHVALNGTYVTTPNISEGDGTVNVEVEIDNDTSSSVSATVSNTVYEKDGSVALASASSTITIAADSTNTVSSAPVVDSPKLWSTDSPNQYTVVTEVIVDGSIVDTYETDFGFRWFEYTSSGFKLNGSVLKLNGVCMHHDQGALGSAAYYDAMYRQLSILKDMGVNAIRTSHNPADEDFIAICSELGILVMEEFFDGWTAAKNGNSNDFSVYFSETIGSDNTVINGSSTMTWAEFVLKATVKRDRNAASVFIWDFGNELITGSSNADTSDFGTIAANMVAWTQSLDTSRSFTFGDNSTDSSGSYNETVMQVLVDNGGVPGYNYTSSSYLSSLASKYNGYLFYTESASAVNSRSVYTTQSSATDADGAYHLTSYDTSAVSWGTTAHQSLWTTLTADYVMGQFVWTGFDYIGEPTPWNGTGTGSVSGSGAVPNSSYFGIVDTAGFEKDTYYLYRSQWNQDSTTLHLVTAWDSDNMMTTSGKTPVVIYSNAPVVKLYRNGTLIGTATRTDNVTSAGIHYYTYSVASNNSSVCTAVSGSDSTSLYATFNVTYASGTISAVAYDENGNIISETYGNSSVSTPGTVSQLEITQSKTVIDADGSSLVYIEVEVQDADGNLDTTAANTINFTLTGNGTIAGVDNGDQATTAKYQQSSVLTSSTTACIEAYAGKALCIVKSTDEAGSISVSVTSSGLTGGTVNITTNAVDEEQTGLVSYTMVKDYTVNVGTVPELQTTATGNLSDGTIVTGTVVWDEISSDVYNTAGDYTVSGILTFDDYGEITVTCKLHVVDDVIALRNVSAAVMAGSVPELPSEVSGILADGTLSGTFTVTWEDMDESQFEVVGDIVTVSGTAVIIGEQTLPVTASVRVAETVNSESTNVAVNASISESVPSGYTSDNLSSVNNGTTKPGDDTSERWSNYNYRTYSDTAYIELSWVTAELISDINLYYYVDGFCAALPDAVDISYSLNGTDFISIDYEESLVESYTYGYEYTYKLASVINPVAIRITLTQQGGTSGTYCVSLTEVETMTYAGSIAVNSDADVDEIYVDGTSAGIIAGVYEYETEGTSESEIIVSDAENAGVTILPAYNNIVRILTISEDTSSTAVYTITLTEKSEESTECSHTNTYVKNASDATCITDGYTGDVYCSDCEELLETGTVISATGHTVVVDEAVAATCTKTGLTEGSHCSVCGEVISVQTVISATGHTVVVDEAVAATCTEPGISEGSHCSVCGEIIVEQYVVSASGHIWDDGVVTKEATTTEEGVMTYTCSICGETKTEAIEKLAEEGLLVPTVTLTTVRNNGKIKMYGYVTGLDDENYYEVTSHGFVYKLSSTLGTRTLTVDISGRTKVTIKGYYSTGSYAYSMTPSTKATKYCFRAFITYVDDDGNTQYVYSDPIYTSYNMIS